MSKHVRTSHDRKAFNVPCMSVVLTFLDWRDHLARLCRLNRASKAAFALEQPSFIAKRLHAEHDWERTTRHGTHYTYIGFNASSLYALLYSPIFACASPSQLQDYLEAHFKKQWSKEWAQRYQADHDSSYLLQTTSARGCPHHHLVLLVPCDVEFNPSHEPLLQAMFARVDALASARDPQTCVVRACIASRDQTGQPLTSGVHHMPFSYEVLRKERKEWV